MRLLAAALVTVALLACDLAADVAGLPASDQEAWGTASGLALILFTLLVLFGDSDRRGKK